MIASMYAPCGCSHSRIGDKLVVYVRCAEHWVPEDDAKILEAEKNHREYISGLVWDEAKRRKERSI